MKIFFAVFFIFNEPFAFFPTHKLRKQPKIRQRIASFLYV